MTRTSTVPQCFNRLVYLKITSNTRKILQKKILSINHRTITNPLIINANVILIICSRSEIHRIYGQAIFEQFLVITTIIFRYKSRQIWRSKLHQCHFIKRHRAWSSLLHKNTCSLHPCYQKTEKIHTVNLSLDRSRQRKKGTAVKQGKIAYSIQTNKMSKIHIHSSSAFKIWVHATAVQYYL